MPRQHLPATDARLYVRARAQLVALAQEAGVELPQSYARLAARLAMRVGRHTHAKQFRRMRKALKTFKCYAGRVIRDLRRHLDDIATGPLRDRIIAKLALVSHLLHQQPKGSDKIYALHEPEVDCISKDKARAYDEFGCKVILLVHLTGHRIDIAADHAVAGLAVQGMKFQLLAIGRRRRHRHSTGGERQFQIALPVVLRGHGILRS